MMILSAKEKICIVSAFWGGPNDTLALPISRFGGGHGPVVPPPGSASDMQSQCTLCLIPWSPAV